MEYLLSFLEGVLTFISPCLLPMLPVYIFYFAGDKEEARRAPAVVNALGFILGFTMVFVALGAFAALLGGLLVRYQTALNIVTGAVVVFFGLRYLGLLPWAGISRSSGTGKVRITGFFSAVLFGVVFSVGWTPCVGAFLGSALMLASQRGSAAQGIGMLLCYSAGLGIPFLLAAVLIDRVKGAIDWIKGHYGVVTKASGLFLIATGVLMMTGLMGRLLTRLSF